MPTMDVRFKNPFYHGNLGLLGGAGDEGTIYILDDKEPLPRTAVVLEGRSQDRKKNEKRGKDAKQAAEQAAIEDDDEEFEPALPKRVKPKEGKAKADNIPKTR
jgi:hypothetical protein